ncbi:hypothetical protein BDP27DRAFT_1425428 [Rhodocollybia butyracea]|uniref:Uncharacterized protein n=1 Tax=Rhodocollybia butyracea TaxID=206335 RepID=A0A9P5PKD5_9AGAR|nr:hypothetical protein BDP27DRAFT_1425428 [Rhodocollybia butyracea]
MAVSDAGKPCNPRKQNLAPFPWAAKDRKLTGALLDGMMKPRNFKILFGQDASQNNQKEPKIAVYNTIASEIVPEAYAANPVVSGRRCMDQGNRLTGLYRKELKNLRDPRVGAKENEYQIDALGPDEHTSDGSRSIWDEIVARFKFFPFMHRYLGARPNISNKKRRLEDLSGDICCQAKDSQKRQRKLDASERREQILKLFEKNLYTLDEARNRLAEVDRAETGSSLYCDDCSSPISCSSSPATVGASSPLTDNIKLLLFASEVLARPQGASDVQH